MASEWLTEDVVERIQCELLDVHADSARWVLEVALSDSAFVDAVIRDRVESRAHAGLVKLPTSNKFGSGTVNVWDYEVLAALGVTTKEPRP